MRIRRAFPYFLVLLLCGCGGEYAAEKQLWKANKLKRTIASSPEGSPPGLFSETRGAFEEVIRLYPGSGKAAEAQMAIGEVYIMEKNPAEAQKAFTECAKK